ncbi:MAG: glycosyltransferase [Motilibacteraceae bacterium]
MPAVVSAIVLVTSLVLGGVATLTLAWMLYAWRSPEGLAATRFSRGEPAPARRLRFSLIVPARHEDEVLGHTLDGLAALEHDDVEILAVVGHDDAETAAVAHAAAERHPDRIRVVVDHSWPKNKPKALNTALAECTGDVVGVFDAEDEVAPGLLRAIEATFNADRADVVQGGVQLMNVQSSWWSLRNCLEYFFWFRSRLHFHADRDFIPLGGNTVFVRTSLLRAVGGWDAECLAEDCELGVRLSSLGAWVSVAYEPALATREETPGSVRALVKQRTRWNQGFLQVLRKGEWRGLPTARQRGLARYTLVTPFLQALTGLLVPVSALLILFAKTPVAVTLVAFVPLLLVLASVIVEAVALHEFGRDYDVPVRLRHYLWLVLGTVPYQWLLAFAAVRAVWREVRGERGWEKTAHTGAHRVPAPAAEIDLRPTPVDVTALDTAARRQPRG